MASKLPDLETPCVACEGKGLQYLSEDDAFHECPICHGGGFVPTDEGKSILALMRHSRIKIVSAELCLGSGSDEL